MSKNTLLLLAGLAVAFLIIAADRSGVDYDTPSTPKQEYIEYASVLWIARVYPDRVDFVSDDRVIFTLPFGVTDRHIQSASYRNLNGYFDPVFVTVWTSGQQHQAMIVDPVARTRLARVKSTHEVDISISDDNRIVLAYTESGQTGEEDKMLIWPE